MMSSRIREWFPSILARLDDIDVARRLSVAAWRAKSKTLEGEQVFL